MAQFKRSVYDLVWTGFALLVSAAWAASPTPRQDLPVFQNTTYGLARNSTGNIIYIGGNIVSGGPETGNCALLDAASGTGNFSFPKILDPESHVSAIISDGNGGWFVGGRFKQVGTVERHDLVHIRADQTLDESWASLTFNNPTDAAYPFYPGFRQIYYGVRCLLLVNGTLYVGGNFADVSGYNRKYLAAFEASTGRLLGWDPQIDDTTAGADTNAVSGVNALSESNGVIYAAGKFAFMKSGHEFKALVSIDTMSGDVNTSWQPGTMQTGGGEPQCYSVLAHGSGVFFSGNFNAIGGTPRSFAAGLAVSNAGLLTWNPSPTDGVFYSMLAIGSTIYVGGDFSNFGGMQRHGLAAVDDANGALTTWNPNSGIGSYACQVYTMAAAGSTLYFGGIITNIGTGQPRSHVGAVALADGSVRTWAPEASLYVRALAVSGGNVLIGGEFVSVNITARSNCAAINISKKQVVPTWAPQVDGYVQCIVVSADDSTIYIAGDFTHVNGVARNYVAAVDTFGNLLAWNPNLTDTSLPNPPGYNSGVRTLVLSPDGNTLYVGGDFTSVNGTPRMKLAALNTLASGLPAGTPRTYPNYAFTVNDDVLALALSGSRLYVGGKISGYGVAINLANGLNTSWSTSFGGPVSTLHIGENGTLYAGGNELSAFDPATGNMSGPGSWPSFNQIYALAQKGTLLYVGGNFSFPSANLGAADTQSGQLLNWKPDPDARVQGLLADGQKLYATGYFGMFNSQSVFVNTFAEFENNAPVATPQSVNFAENTYNAIALEGVDADGDDLAFRIESLPTNGTLYQTQDGANPDYAAPITGALPKTVTYAGHVVVFVPADMYTNGPDSFTFSVDDGVAPTSTATIDIVINPVNNPPTLDTVTDQSFLEDSGFQFVPLTGIGTGASNEFQTLSVGAVVTARRDLIPSVTVYYSSPDGTGWLGLSLADNTIGTLAGGDAATVKVVVRDDSGGEVFRVFQVEVQPVNHAPTLDTIADRSINENATQQTVSLGGISPGIANESAQTLTIAATSDAQSLIPNPGITYTPGSATGTLTFTPAASQYGSAIISVTVTDDGGMANGGVNAVTNKFKVTVNRVNQPPTISSITDQTINEKTSTSAISFTVGDRETDPNVLNLSVASSNESLVPLSSIAMGGSGASRTITITPVRTLSGFSNITLRVFDQDGASAARTFRLNVTEVPDAPAIGAIANQTINEDNATSAVPFTVSDEETSAANLTLTGSSSDTSLVPNSGIVFGGSGASRTITVTPAANQFGTAIITVTVKDDTNLTASTTFAVTVLPVNDPPVANGGNVATPDDTPVTITLAATDLANENETLNFMIMTSPSQGTLGALNSDHTIVYTPKTGATGIFSFTYEVNDGALDSSDAAVSITVTAGKVPAITSLSQTSAVVKGAGFTLTVDGSNFTSGATVLWNGAALPTTFVSATRVTSTVATSNLSTDGRLDVKVLNPAPGGGTSNAASFYVYSGLTAGSWIVTNTHDSGSGSLRLAMASARSDDVIQFDPTIFDLVNSDAATIINVLSPLPALASGSVTIDAQNRRVTVNGTAAGSTDGFTITSSKNVLMGLTIVGFDRSAISISGAAQGNVLGGSRSAGTGPNGQGLRLGNNGICGVHISGAGTDGNTIKGCWIGLGASGKDANGNLAGILIEDGAKSNTLGGTGAGEANVVSGNTYEGITVSGDGTDGNLVVGNIVGAAAILESSIRDVGSRAETETLGGRTSVRNGSAGVFLSRGTKSTRVGGTNAGEPNLVGFNGGKGIEVRAVASKRNSSRGNAISRNQGGGIALYDGSNQNVHKPVIDTMERLTGRSVATRGTASVKISGSSDSASGIVELFTDSGEQGGFLVGRGPVSGGKWEVTADVSETDNITATFTDDSDNTSEFGVMGRAPAASGGSGSTVDTDGDGVPDALEVLAGTDPNNASDAPAVQGAVVVDKIGVSLSFTTGNKDALSATMRLILPEGYINLGATVAVQFADYTEKFTSFDAKGTGTASGATLKFAGASTVAGPAAIGTLSFAAKSKTLLTSLASAGFVSTTTTTTLTVPVGVSLTTGDGKKYVYAGKVKVLYKAAQGKSGKAAKAK
ncbi:MAG TPA: tandem-95 repeat protein [Planctomycetota bacterium]|jgi:hypothetical protein